MKYIIFYFFSILTLSFSFVSAQSSKKINKDTKAWRYEIEVVQTGVDGTYLIKVWSYSKKPVNANEQVRKNAIHGIIFKGFSGSGQIAGQKPLTNNPNLEIEKAEFFDDFFQNGGKYSKFINLVGDGSIASGDIIKVDKEYKIGLVVSVYVFALRKDLEDAGIIKSLNSGF